MLISRTATHCRSTAAVRIATAAAESANHGTVWGVTAADRRDVLKTLAGTRPHTRGCSTENNANRRGGSRRSAAVSCVSSPQGRDSSPCRSQLPRGVHRPRKEVALQRLAAQVQQELAPLCGRVQTIEALDRIHPAETERRFGADRRDGSPQGDQHRRDDDPCGRRHHPAHHLVAAAGLRRRAPDLRGLRPLPGARPAADDARLLRPALAAPVAAGAAPP